MSTGLALGVELVSSRQGMTVFIAQGYASRMLGMLGTQNGSGRVLHLNYAHGTLGIVSVAARLAGVSGHGLYVLHAKVRN